MNRIRLLLLATTGMLTACAGTSSHGGGTGGSSSAQDSGGAAGTTCSPDGDRLILRGAFAARSQDLRVILRPADPNAVESVVGSDEAGKVLMLSRAGDVSEAAFTAPGTFDVSVYPSNIHFIRGQVSGQQFEEGFIAQRGELVVMEVRPVLRATFHLEELQASADVHPMLGGPVIAGAVDGCIAVR